MGGKGLCHCGCGQKTNIARVTRRAVGRVRGQPQSFCHGHNRTLLQRFWSKVRLTVANGLLPGCWLWTGTTINGYGYISIGSKRQRAPRVSWFLAFGAWPPPGAYVCHTCDTPACVRPSHLFLGTAKDNAQDMIRKGRKASQAGSQNNAAKLTEEEVGIIRALYRAGSVTQTQLASRFGVALTTISSVVLGYNWSPVAFERISGCGGGSGDIPETCRAKDATGSPDDLWIRVKQTERAIPEENSGFADHRALPSEGAGYDMYGYGGG